MADLFLFSVAESLIEKLASSAYQQASRVIGVYEDLQEFKETLRLIKAVLLDADQKREHNHESLFLRIKLPTLKVLSVSDCENLKFLALDINHFPELEAFMIDQCGNLELSKEHDDPKFYLRLKAIGLMSLPQLVTLPHWLQESANTLQHMSIYRCENFEVLPEWLLTLSFMKSIIIRDCPKLKSLPKDTPRLTALGYLEIEDCPELFRKCQPLVGEFWPKISHIKQVVLEELTRRYREELVEDDKEHKKKVKLS